MFGFATILNYFSNLKSKSFLEIIEKNIVFLKLEIIVENPVAFVKPLGGKDRRMQAFSI